MILLKKIKHFSEFVVILRIFLGILFILSGWVKSVDPIGVGYSIKEYLVSFGLECFTPYNDVFAILLCFLEIFIGLMLLCGLLKKIISIITILLMLSFTIVTLLLVLLPMITIQDCGCFGNAIGLTNLESLLKNIIILILSLFHFKNTLTSKKNDKTPIIIIAYITVISLLTPIYPYINLPPIDFLPFNIGENLLVNKNNVKDNINNGRSIDTKEYMSYLSIYDDNDLDATEKVLSNKIEYLFLVSVRELDDLTIYDLEKLEHIRRLSDNKVIKLYILTSSNIKNRLDILSTVEWEDIELLYIDDIALKSLIRPRKGLIMLNNGVVVGKWNLAIRIPQDIEYSDLENLINYNTQNSYFILIIIALSILAYLIINYNNQTIKHE